MTVDPHMESQSSNDGGAYKKGNGSLTNHGGDYATSASACASTSASASSESPLAALQGRSLSESLSPAECTKVTSIVTACESGRPIHLLIAMATSRAGFVDDEVRRLAWPILLAYDMKTPTETEASQPWQDLPRHKDEDQVELDVNRSFIYYPKNESGEQLDRRKAQLSAVITQVLRQYPMLSYFQGFHDIVQVFLLVLGVDHATEAVSHLALLRIRDFMLQSLAPSLAHLQLLPAILSAVDPMLCQHLSQTQPFFALAATLTLYAHDIQEYGDIARLFDFLLAHGAVVSVYFFAIIVLSRREELFEIPAEEPEMLHSVLSKLPKPLDLEALISRTMTVFTEHPPEKLPFGAWSKISPFSVLKTTRESIGMQDLQAGLDLFAMQALQLRRTELRAQVLAMLWKYRRPATNFGLVVFVGVVSIWLRRGGMNNGIPGFLSRKLLDFFRLIRRN